MVTKKDLKQKIEQLDSAYEECLKLESELDEVERDILRMFRLSTPEEKQAILKMGAAFIWYNETLRIATEKEIILWDI